MSADQALSVDYCAIFARQMRPDQRRPSFKVHDLSINRLNFLDLVGVQLQDRIRLAGSRRFSDL
jgi:hypothetical protein